MMKPEIKERWLKALRSGEYEQGKRHLRSIDNKFCCLGVLCDLYIKEKGLKWETGKSSLSDTEIYVTPENGKVYPTLTIMEWAGLPDRNPSVKTQGFLGFSKESMTLSDANDFRNKSFEDIATLIENNL